MHPTQRNSGGVVTPPCDPAPKESRNPATTQARPLPSDGIVAIQPAARAAWDVLRGIAYAVPGTILVGLAGC
jgi:hypothetical protein